jgi:rSAM/selenodomain-associated transferase 2
MEHGARVIDSPRGRGTQLRNGAAAARGEWLFFLHADSIVTNDLPAILLDATNDPAFNIGTFRLRLEGKHPLYQLYSWFTRFDSIWTSFGDQGIVIRRSLYERIGGFPDWPLLEDVALLQRARKVAHIRSLPAEIITSARRFERHGILRQQIRNGAIIMRYLFGATPDDLLHMYDAESPRAAESEIQLTVRAINPQPEKVFD